MAALNFPRAAPIIISVKGTLRQAPGESRFRVSTDIVVFTVRRDTLEVLLCRQEDDSNERGAWALPGGFVADREPLDASARRALVAHTGLADIYLEQLFTFGQPERHPGPRVISVAYFALVPGDRLTGFEPGRAGGTWWDAARLPALYLDHEQIIDTARERLAAKLEYSTIAFQLMPDQFTLSELQGVYETIQDRPVDKRNFRKRVLALEHIQATDRKRRNGSHRPARLYRYTARDAIEILK